MSTGNHITANHFSLNSEFKVISKMTKLIGKIDRMVNIFIPVDPLK